MKPALFLVIGAIMASTPVNALEYFDDIERYADGQNVTLDDTYEIILPEWDVNQGPPFATSGNLGATPFSGNRMIEMRTASIGRPNIMRAPAPRGLGEFPGWELSVKVFVSSQEFVGQGFSLGFVQEGEHFLSLNFSTGMCSSFLMNDVFVPNIKDRWVEAKLQFDRVRRELRAWVDGKALGKRVLSGTFAGVSGVSFGVGQGKDLTATYPRSSGSPGVFLDNYRITSVPDPVSAAGILMGAAVVAVRKKK